ncbi:hypothetical protein Tco_0846098 [Tanacetum coccineum]
MTTLAEFMIISGADNRPPMLEKSMYDSWKSRMELYLENRKKDRMILNSGLPPDVYAIVNHHKVAKEIWDRVKLLMQCHVVPVFTQGNDPIACLNKAMAFLSAVATSRTYGYALNLRGQGTLQDPGILDGQAAQTTIPNNAAFQTKDLDAYDSDYDDVSNAKVVLMANISNYALDVISEVPHSKTYHHEMDNQSVHAMQDFEQTPVVDFPDNEITSDTNIILYSQYLQETQQTVVQDTNLYSQQDSMILSVIEQMSEQMINHVNN